MQTGVASEDAMVAVGINLEMHKTALGAEYTVDWKYFKRTQDAVNELHNDGYT